MIHELEQLVITKLTPLVSDVNGTAYMVVENDGSMLEEIEDPNEPGEGIYIIKPAVTVEHTSTSLVGMVARESSADYLPSPYDVEHTVTVTIWQPMEDSETQFDSAIKRVLTLPAVMFKDETQRRRQYMWTSLSKDEYDATYSMDARNLSMILMVRETGVDLLNLV